MHPPEVRAEAMRLIAAGINDCEISRQIGVPRRTILDWRRPTYVPRQPAIPRETCPRCWRVARPVRFTGDDYAELLGLYLGDGCISEMRRTFRLRIALDTKYPGIIEDGRRLLERCFPHNGVGVQDVPAYIHVYLSTYSRHLPCLFPQHGPGKKHERPILLESWQRDLVEKAPWSFLRGCIRSDGCAFVNRTGPYEYLSYDFSNRSGDFVRLFVDICDLLDIKYRSNYNEKRRLWHVRINRRGCVARMLRHVGLKR
jgi:Homeodomain-like domain-containing protein/LAGLIDADG DNA endonuclease family protein